VKCLVYPNILLQSVNDLINLLFSCVFGFLHSSAALTHSYKSRMIRYDTIEEFNVDSKLESWVFSLIKWKFSRRLQTLQEVCSAHGVWKYIVIFLEY